MAWSTRELAERAGVTLNTIRHYHRMGLLPEPTRLANGYKQYGPRHLVRVLRIRRLVELGVPLAEMDDLSREDNADALRALDERLVAKIARLQEAREGIAALLREGAPLDSPEGFEAVARGLSEGDTAVLHIYARMYDEQTLDSLKEMVASDPDEESAALDSLPADADEETRAALAATWAPILAENLRRHPWLTDPASRAATDATLTHETLVRTVVEYYNAAQLDVLARASLQAKALLGDALPPSDAGKTL